MKRKIAALLDSTLPLVSNLSNVSAVLNEMDNVNWCGFYLVEKDALVLGPFQGEVACTRIPKGKGVCGTAFLKKSTVIVPDVSRFEGHIACSQKSKSEIVVPILKQGKVVAVIDIDSPVLNRFDQADAALLEEIAVLLAPLF